MFIRHEPDEVVLGVWLDALGVVDKRGEDDDAEHQEEDEENELLGGSAECVDEDLEAGGMLRQLEQPHDADDGEELQDVLKQRMNWWVRIAAFFRNCSGCKFFIGC